jgi:hypothetical protein
MITIGTVLRGRSSSTRPAALLIGRPLRRPSTSLCPPCLPDGCRALASMRAQSQRCSWCARLRLVAALVRLHSSLGMRHSLWTDSVEVRSGLAAQPEVRYGSLSSRARKGRSVLNALIAKNWAQSASQRGVKRAHYVAHTVVPTIHVIRQFCSPFEHASRDALCWLCASTLRCSSVLCVPERGRPIKLVQPTEYVYLHAAPRSWPVDSRSPEPRLCRSPASETDSVVIGK